MSALINLMRNATHEVVCRIVARIRYELSESFLKYSILFQGGQLGFFYPGLTPFL